MGALQTIRRHRSEELQLPVMPRKKEQDKRSESVYKEIYYGESNDCDWPGFFHHCTQVKEIWVQYHEVLPKFGLRFNSDGLKIERSFLSDFKKMPAFFAFVGLTHTEKVPTVISSDTKLVSIFKTAERKSGAFFDLCVKSKIAPLFIISNVDAERHALCYGEIYRKCVKRECVVVVLCEKEQCNHNRIDLKRLIAYTCKMSTTAIRTCISTLLKQWTYSMLAKRINAMKILFDFTQDGHIPPQQLRVLQIDYSGAPKHNDDRNARILKGLLEESRALFSRNNLPAELCPAFPRVLKRPDKSMLHHISKKDYVVGCGDRFGTFLVLIDEEVEDRKTTEKELKSELKEFGFENGDLELKYVSKRLQYFFKAGDTIFCNNDTSYGTLAGFASKDEHGMNDKVFALFSKHVAVFCSKLKIGKETIGDVLETNNEGVDIAAAEIYPHLANKCDHKFVTEENIERTCISFDPSTTDIPLQGTLVHLVGAASEDIGLGKVTVTNFCSNQANGMSTFLLENRKSNKHVFCEPGDSGAMILTYFPDEDKLVALGMLIGSAEKKNEDKTEAYAHPFFSSNKKHRAKHAQKVAGQIYAAFYLQDGLNELSKIHGGQFCLIGANNNI